MNIGMSLFMIALVIFAGLLFAGQLLNTNQRLHPLTTSLSTQDPTKPAIIVLAPNGGEILKARQVYAIRWEANRVGNVYIRLVQGVKDHGYIASDILASEGFYHWTVPAELVADFGENGYKIIIDDNNVKGVSDSSDGTFMIKK